MIWKSKSAITKMQALAIVIIIVVAAIAAYYLTRPTPTLIKNPDTIITTVYGPPSTLDPAFAYDGIVQIMNVYETLIFFDKEHIDRFRPVLATEVPTIENGLISPDGLTYIFPIRKGVKFHNGNPLTPEDVEYSFERMMVCDPDGGPVWMLLQPLLDRYCTRDENGNIAVSAEEIDKAVESNATHVIFHLKKPYPAFLQILSLSVGVILDKEWCIEQGCWPGTWNNWTEYNNPSTPPLDTKMMGTGPFKFEKWDRSAGEFIIVRNEDYWGEPAKVKRVVWKFIPEWSTKIMMFLKGDIDIIADVPKAYIQQLEGVEGIVCFKDLPLLAIITMVFNFNISSTSPYIGSGKLDGEGIPPNFFADKYVRLGFAYSFPYEEYIQEAYLGEAKRIATCIPDNIPFYNPEQEMYSLNLTKAEECFRKAFNGELWEKGFKVTVPYGIGMDYEEETRIALEMLAENLREVNPKFQLIIQGVELTTYEAQLYGEDPSPVPLNAAAMWWADFADPDNFFSGFMGSAGMYSWNMYFSTPYIDELLANGSSTLDPEVRREVYYELQRIYHDEVLGIPLVQLIGRWYQRDWIKGWYFRPVWEEVVLYSELEKGY